MWRIGWAPNLIPIYINKTQRYTVYLHLEIAQNVSGGTSTQHQERIQNIWMQQRICTKKCCPCGQEAIKYFCSICTHTAIWIRDYSGNGYDVDEFCDSEMLLLRGGSLKSSVAHRYRGAAPRHIQRLARLRIKKAELINLYPANVENWVSSK
jgi:hypothetical protein